MLSEALVKQWCWSKNLGMAPEQFLPMSGRRVWWQCEAGHDWEAVIASRTKGAGCPYCSGRRAITGVNDLLTVNPALAAQWHPTKNGTRLAAATTAGSSTKAWWLGDCGHEWEATPSSRNRGKGCPYCASRILLAGFNDLLTVNPSLAAQWHPTKNNDLLPSMVPNSGKAKYWWIGDCGHEWEASLGSRRLGSGCPYCAHQLVEVGVTDLATVNPALAAQWHSTKNKGLLPQQVLPFTRRSAWWLGDCGHEWEATIANRSNGAACPFCAGRSLLVGFNDLATVNPDIAAEWHPYKNGNLNPQMVMLGSDVKIWWQDTHGHEWETYVYSRAAGNGCPECANARYTSRGEDEVAAFLGAAGLNVVRHDRKQLAGLELDIYLPQQQLAVEFNGLFYHTEAMQGGAETHAAKWAAAKAAGIQLIYVWEDDWRYRRGIVERMLLNKASAASEPSIGARKTQTSPIVPAAARTFLEDNHIQGYSDGTTSYALYWNEQLVAVMSIRMQNNVLHIVRYATAMNVQGGFSKLLAYVVSLQKPKRVETFSDHGVSDGALYERNGFVRAKEISADYMYVAGRRRVHKFNYRLARFRTDSALIYKPGLTERELAALNKLHRIWDAGKVLWVKEIQS